MERLLSYGMDKAFEGLAICEDYIDCIKKCVKKGEEREVCSNNCNTNVVTEYGLSLDTEISDECSMILGVDFEKIIDNMVKEIRGEIP